MLPGDPIERVWALYEERQDEFDERGWSLRDVYLELGGGGPRSSELHARFGDFFNGQTRGALAGGENEAKLDYWAGIPERGAALRDEALAILAQEDDSAVARGEQIGSGDGATVPGPDPQTRSLLLAHNQIDLELHAHFLGIVGRELPRTPVRATRPPARRGAICVLGAPRSGTSLTARILNIVGVDLGDEEELMEPAADNNRSGFWEHQGIADLNEGILATLGDAPRQRWRWPPPLEEGWQDDPRLEAHRRAARSMLRRSFSSRPLWGWKDPRTCLTLPFWEKVLAGTPEVESQLRYVICFRHPVDVAASLAARDGMPTEEALKLWLRYMSSAMSHTSGQRRLCVAYESYFPDCQAQGGRLAAFLGLPPPGPEQRQAIGAHVDGDLRHHRRATRASGEDLSLPPDVRELYTELLELTAA